MEENINLDDYDFPVNDNSKTKLSIRFEAIQDYSSPKHIPYKDKLYLTPIQKYRIYGTFPIRMIFDIALTILTTIQITMINGPTTEYTKAVERLFYDIFLQNDSTDSKDFPRIKYLYTLDDLRETVLSSQTGYYNISNTALGNLTFSELNDENNKIFVSIDYIDVDSDIELMAEYNMTENDSWIFNSTIDILSTIISN